MKFLQGLFSGYKTYMFAILQAMLPFISTAAEKFIQENTGIYAALVSCAMILLRQLTTTPPKLGPGA